MKVIFSNSLPFFLAHGGIQTVIEALTREMPALGIEVEPERWWDDKQTGDIIHFFSRPHIENVRFAHQKGFKVVFSDTMGQAASRSPLALAVQRSVMTLARKIVPGGFLERLSWDVYREVDAMTFIVDYEWQVAQYLQRATPGRGHIVPLGVDDEAKVELAKPQPEEDYLVCLATIRSIKNSVLLAQAAQIAKTPIVFLGSPYSANDPYFVEFKKCVDGKIVRYPGFASGEAKYRWLRGARGFALLSQFESGSIAVYEAAAAGLPLFLSDLAWANKVYHEVPGTKFARLASPSSIAPVLKDFYNQSHRQPKPTFPVLTWRQVAEKHAEVYRKVMGCA